MLCLWQLQVAKEYYQDAPNVAVGLMGAVGVEVVLEVVLEVEVGLGHADPASLERRVGQLSPGRLERRMDPQGRADLEDLGLSPGCPFAKTCLPSAAPFDVDTQ